VKGCAVEINLIPAQGDQLTHPEALPVGHKDHRGVAMGVAIVLGCPDQPLDLRLGQVFARPKIRVWPTLWRNCSIFDGWRDYAQMRFNWALPLVLDPDQ
jgi:hypothetical protein